VGIVEGIILVKDVGTFELMNLRMDGFFERQL
jgi:hypothetical protein